MKHNTIMHTSKQAKIPILPRFLPCCLCNEVGIGLKNNGKRESNEFDIDLECLMVYYIIDYRYGWINFSLLSRNRDTNLIESYVVIGFFYLVRKGLGF